MKSDWLRLKEKTIIVTGGASGIGFAIVQELLKNGANVAICDMQKEAPKIDAGLSKRMVYIKTDVTNKEEIECMVNLVKQRFGGIDALINNAGINIPRLLLDIDGQYELDEIVWDKVMNTNVKGTMLCSQIVAYEMTKSGSGVIVNMSSESGLEGSEGQSVYAASKNAINSLTRSWAKELGKKGIRVVGVAPGIMEATNLRTPQYENALAYTRNISVEQLRESYANVSTIPLGRSGKLTEVANLVAFLVSERSSYIHGVTINIAGGKTRG